jgi:hypothetical protein
MDWHMFNLVAGKSKSNKIARSLLRRRVDIRKRSRALTLERQRLKDGIFGLRNEALCIGLW